MNCIRSMLIEERTTRNHASAPSHEPLGVPGYIMFHILPAPFVHKPIALQRSWIKYSIQHPGLVGGRNRETLAAFKPTPSIVSTWKLLLHLGRWTFAQQDIRWRFHAWESVPGLINNRAMLDSKCCARAATGMH